jgi:competence protein ComEC
VLSLSTLCAGSLVAGAAIGIVSRVPPLDISAPLLIAIAVALVAAVAWAAPPRRHLAFACILAAAGVQHGAAAREAALHPAIRLLLDAAFGGFTVGAREVEGRHDPVLLRAVLIEDAAARDGFVSLRVRAREVLLDGRWQQIDGGLSISVNGAASDGRIDRWRRGRTIETPVTFRRPARYLNAGVADLERDAALDGLALFASVKSGLLVNVISKANIVAELAGETRATVRRAVARWVLPHGEVPAAIVTAVLIGDRTGLPDEIRTRLQAAGTYHVIAISGGNIAILAALVIGAFTLIGIPARGAALATVIVLLAYAEIVAAGPSVWRATVMAVLYFSARLFDHRTPPWHALTLTAGAIAVVQPLDVRDAGFLLTFGATAALLAAGHVATNWFDRGVVKWLVASIVASLAAELVLLPVSAGVFSRVTAAGLLLNLIAIPAMAIVQVGGMIVVAFARLPILAASAGWMAAHGASVLVDSARLVDSVPALVHRVPPPAGWIIAVYYGALLLAAWRGTFRARIASRISLAFAGVLIVTGTNPIAARPRADVLRLTMIDVGQGESMLLEIPGAASVLIDTGGSPFGGGSFDIGSRVLAPALWARRVRQLGTLLVTHGDPDHIGGATSILSDFNPRFAWWGTPVPPHQPSRDFLEAAGRQGSVIAFRRAAEEFSVGAARVRVLHPPPPDWERQKVRNDDSVVLEVVYHDVALLLTGDVSADIERRIAPQLTPARLRVLKVAHHGSRTSSSRVLLDSWKPQIALISCGRGNTFGHPAPDVLARLESIGARVYRTDRDGEITLESDGREVWVTTFTGEKP